MVYIGTTGGVARYDRYRHEWELPLTVSDGLIDNHVEEVIIDPSTDDVWFKTKSGYSVFWPTSNTWREGTFLPDELVQNRPDLNPLPELFMPFGFMFFPEGYILDHNHRKYPVTDYWADHWGNLWIGTWGLGVGKADLRTHRLEMYPLGLKEENVNAIAISGDRLWFGGIHGEGITLYDRGAQTWRYFEAHLIPGLKSDQVRAIIAEDRFVWLGTTYGLSRYDVEKDAWLTYTMFDTLQADEITALEKDGEYLWIGTVSGVSRLNMLSGHKEIMNAPPIKFRYVNDIAVGRGFVWFSTDRGIFRWERTTGLWDHFDDGEGLLVGEVHAVSSFGSEIWFASSLGIGCLDTETAHWQRYPAVIFLDNGEPTRLVATEKAVWAGSTQGVWKFDRRREEWFHFDQRDGLTDNRVQAIALDGDYVWFGTLKGVTRFFWNSPHRFD